MSGIIEYLESENFYMPDGGAKVLDFGCGKGGLVKQLRGRGLDAHGVDLIATWDSGMIGACHEFLAGYRIPFDDNEFDLVVSTSVMEHVLNKQEAFLEIHRVLKPGGHALHAFPSKFFLPVEPHIKIPLVSWLHPKIPKIYLAASALLGFRNDHQLDMSWREVLSANLVYVEKGLSYWSRPRYLACANSIYSESAFDDSYASFGRGTVGRIDRKLKIRVLRKIWRKLATLFRYQVLMCRK